MFTVNTVDRAARLALIGLRRFVGISGGGDGLHRGLRALAVGLALVGGGLAHAADAVAPPGMPVISLIIDDMGNLLARGRRAIELPGPIAYSFLPHTPHARHLAALAHSHNKEVMLHLPMQAMAERALGPGGLTLDMSYQEFATALQADIESVPNVVGINNHMGSLLTRHPGHMLWLMQSINRHGNLFFVDSYTTEDSIGIKIATENRVPNLRRDVFLDNTIDRAAIRRQFTRLLDRARKHGVGLGIAHPYTETVEVLEELLPTLEAQGVQLIPVSTMVTQQRERIEQWQAYSSR